ncbi:nitrite reductase (NO-forming) [Parapedobacter composti]|uniref:Nitrite reductase (NO-forming) n=1 Tax=Parapedobacter composti TaxID=623281 RepID=A0A1I1LCD1_9SPHI|nr:cytochrome c [Parapedobacter composti]SFC70797.1 nitrite reductase (NO-forming) [Parapedobacter composti]
MRNTCIAIGAALLGLYVTGQSCQSGEAIRTAQYITNGQKIYSMHCQNCHGARGEGLGNLYPPLTDTAFLLSHRQQLACMVKNGISGPMEVDGRVFNTEMPPNPQLAPVEIAYVLTYIGNSFGNKMGIFPQEEVQAVLDNCN